MHKPSSLHHLWAPFTCHLLSCSCGSVCSQTISVPSGVTGSAHCSPAAWAGLRWAAEASANASCCQRFSPKLCLAIFISQTSEFKTIPECYRLITRSPSPSVLVPFSNSAGCWGNKNTSINCILLLYFQQNIFLWKWTSPCSSCNPDVGAFC